MTLELPTQWDSQTSEEILSMGLTPYHPDYSVRFRWLLLLKVRLSSWEDCLIRCLTLCQHLLFLSHISVCQLWDSSLDAHLHAQNLLPFWLYSFLSPSPSAVKSRNHRIIPLQYKSIRAPEEHLWFLGRLCPAHHLRIDSLQPFIFWYLGFWGEVY